MENAYHHADEVLRSSQDHPLFIGDITAAEDAPWLQRNNILTVITVASGFQLAYPPSITHIRYELEDSKRENISGCFEECSRQIERCLKKGGVLVHCGAGVSRSATVVIAYLIKYRAMSFAQALKLLKAKRPQVCPNLGFQLQLKTYQAKLHIQHSFNERKLMIRGKRQRAPQLPEIVKVNPLQTAYNPTYYPQSRVKPDMSKSLQPRQKQELDYIRKMAEFRFGITITSSWKLPSRTHPLRPL